MTRIKSFQIPTQFILLGISLQLVILLAADRVSNDRIHRRSTEKTLDQSDGTKTHQKPENGLHQTIASAGPSGSLLIDPDHGLEPVSLPALVQTRLPQAPVEGTTSPIQMVTPFQGFSGNMTISVPTPAFTVPTATANLSYTLYPTSTANNLPSTVYRTNSTYNDSTLIGQNITVAYQTINIATPTPAIPSPEPSTSIKVIYPTAPPTVSNSASQRSANSTWAYFLSAPLSLTFLIASVTIALSSFILLGY